MARSTDSWDESDVRIRPSKKGSRPRTKDRPSHDDAVTGRIITVDRGRYTAVVGEDSGDERIIIAARARELRRSPVVAGDFVSLVGDVSGEPDTLARLVRIQDRRTLLRRSADDTDPIERAVVANADQLVVVVAAANPEPRTGFIDRALVAAYDAGIEPLLLVTKADVKDPAELLSNYEHLDFPVIISRTSDSEASGIDARSDDGLSARLDSDAVSQLRAYLEGKVSVMLGHSGVGKSTMVNALTGAERATGGVNAVTGRGRHTSSSALALKLTGAPTGSWIIDTPGIRSFGLAHVDPDRILRSFPDLEPGTDACERGCKHNTAAVNCGVDAWVSAGHAGPTGPARLASLRRLLGTDPRLVGQETKELGSIG
ncbi:MULTISPECIES: ribosome small subunit-dependent GTPase A [unclassified Pseudarthrobacter]|uniref:ribosome small subunit-dependent GTPase A n=1 Tax=unclassified Pseudarthrobacter TaxID=2647000 RepID=UPI001130C911|nr:ribosome small subunit-dependent GTPase A [Pseudarthrobacter sp. NIBRBAC000502772]QDG67581.1 ribosome small subunit-dependent GTPase A [Pseudarthrobacter sp. NIBRBAC000502772]